MQLTFLYLLEGQEAVNDVDSDIEGLRLKSKLPMDIDDPLDEEGTAGILDLSRHLDSREVVGIHLKLDLLLAHVLVDLLGQLCHHLGVANLKLVCEDHTLAHGAAPLGEALLVGFSDRCTSSSLLLGRG